MIPVVPEFRPGDKTVNVSFKVLEERSPMSLIRRGAFARSLRSKDDPSRSLHQKSLVQRRSIGKPSAEVSSPKMIYREAFDRRSSEMLNQPKTINNDAMSHQRSWVIVGGHGFPINL